MRAAMLLFAALCIGIGIVPGPLYALLPYPVDFVPYTGSHVVLMLQLLLFSGLAFFLMLGWLKRTLTITLDVDWLYRRFGVLLMRSLDRSAESGWNGVTTAAARAARGVLGGVHRHHGPDGMLARTWPTGSMAFWTTIMLAAYLILSYL
jgi:multicomponent Na+:H+ antiporter subunit D